MTLKTLKESNLSKVCDVDKLHNANSKLASLLAIAYDRAYDGNESINETIKNLDDYDAEYSAISADAKYSANSASVEIQDTLKVLKLIAEFIIENHKPISNFRPKE